MFEHLIKRAKTVMEALPYLIKFSGKTVVIKYGGAAMENPELKNAVMRDIVLLKYVGINPVIVHGGGPEINLFLKRRGIEPKFVNGLRVTTLDVMSVVEHVLGNRINSEIVSLIKKNGGRAKGFFGRKGEVIKAKKHWAKDDKNRDLDLGFTGDVVGVRYRFLRRWMKLGYIPVLSPIGVGHRKKSYNINADSAAAAVAACLKASKLILMTNVRGVLDNKGELLSSINSKKASGMISSGQISGGMIPKIKSGLCAIKDGVEKVHIIDGRIPHAILLEIFTDYGIGTMVEN
ncbi:acetylglutamate kinase [candidate division WOR-1 bacterium RIFOXYA2_FULL_36_21]|uniref:Acetylglutamate kinase n=1 Tax=candidate division WOR-1 bacterium RIFOXYB2_FULL_36_35 TaxID=1802578 RepID=A0A1F4S0R9_UNCSA|nr:MAG: acetylglutamate kinase [candidate division WOR-1 bacterium RIFOXYA2_FULL_36_21]OGC14031.1 MAG: acetylglutamate kinase [candidate division WOR-1 bacterium RIFOXYB2_FULL_36_35]OGC14966.1 MAG: acetylglutamate kinase [candidate division WOR-1 bacterium RIFOXYA12_FULL_36_13]